LADPRALESIFYAQEAWRRQPQSSASVIVPQYEFSNSNRNKKIDVPVLMAYGAKDPMFADKDENEYKKVFTKMKWVEFQNSADTPWAEEPVAFFDAFNELLKDNKILERIEKEGNKKK
jgi:pimeloyl-ACP methyl ester carboxylesterase